MQKKYMLKIQIFFEKILGWMFVLIRNIIQLDKRKILFITFQDEYTCNPKYICEELRYSNTDAELIWVVFDEKQEKKIPKEVKKVRIGSFRYYIALYSSKVIIDNAFNIAKRPFKKKERQYFLQTMHGSLGIKRIDKDSNRTTSRNKRGEASARETDYIISNSTFEDMVYRTSFWSETTILKYGHPRNDILVNLKKNKEKQDEINKKIRQFYGLSENVKIVMYAPTYEEKLENDEVIDLEKVVESLEKRFGGMWVVLNRLHPRDAKRKHAISNNITVLDGNLWVDIQELMIACDFAITNYSSWIFDFVLMCRPGVIYAPTVEDYQNKTGLYYPLETTPFPVTKSNKELETAILLFDTQSYSEKVEAFLGEKGCVDDGYASTRVVKMINELLEK